MKKREKECRKKERNITQAERLCVREKKRRNEGMKERINIREGRREGKETSK